MIGFNFDQPVPIVDVLQAFGLSKREALGLIRIGAVSNDGAKTTKANYEDTTTELIITIGEAK